MNDMNVWTGFTSALSKYATFKGRARRMEYWGWTLFIVIFSAILSLIEETLKIDIFTSIFALAVVIPCIAVAVRRLHDIGKSGFNYFWGFLPIIGWIMLIIWFCREGEYGENEYGSNPKHFDADND